MIPVGVDLPLLRPFNPLELAFPPTAWELRTGLVMPSGSEKIHHDVFGIIMHALRCKMTLVSILLIP